MANPKGPGTDSSGGGEAPATTAARVSVNVGRAVLGWGVLFVILTAGADIPATAEIAAAFAWLIFFAVALLYGESALTTLSSLLRKES